MSAPIIAAFSPRHADRGPVDFALAACRATGAPLVVVAIGVADGDPAIAALEADLAAQDVPYGIRLEEHASAARGVTRVTAELSPELLVVGSSRHGSHGHVRPGSTAERLLAGATGPVAVVPRDHPAKTPRGVIGVGYVPTTQGRATLRAAGELAHAFGARLRVITVLDPRHAEEQSPGLMAAQHHDVDVEERIDSRHRLAAREDLEAAMADLPAGVETEVDVLYQDPVDGLVAASSLVDLLVIGSRGRGTVHAVLTGGVSRRVVARASSPVLVLPSGGGESTEALVAAAEGRGPE
jgi:nucleotide-binding universal stress UspA family protein